MRKKQYKKITKACVPKWFRKKHPKVSGYADSMARRMTPAEFSFYKTAKWMFKDLYFQRPVEIGGTPNKTYILDFFIKGSRLGIEIDGDDHGLKKDKDDLRTRLLRTIYITIVRFPNSLAIEDPNFCCSIVSQWDWHIKNGNMITDEARKFLHFPYHENTSAACDSHKTESGMAILGG